MGKEEAVRLGVIARRLADGLISVLLAPPCAACAAPLNHPTAGPVCDSCWRSAAVAASPFEVPHVERGRGAGIYTGSLREIVHALKYQHRTSLARPLATLIVRHCADVLDGADLVVPVPLHRSRLRERGFNQAALIARELPLPCADVLARVRPTASQTDLPAHERRRNVRDAFAIADPKSRASVDERVIVLVDDVATTGATLSECGRVLKQAGAGEVRAVTAARAP
ncbi:MAG TPA: ComF family protein [Vicinamibacterales bacterium]|nr:ComF family protein [Vicinamibacterales bacterium]